MRSRIILAIIIGVVFLLFTPLLQQEQALPFDAYATVQAQDKVAAQSAEADYLTLLRLASQEPAQALDGLDSYAFSPSIYAEDARGLAQSIRFAELQESEAYSLTAVAQAFARLAQWELSVSALLRATAADPNYAEAWAYLAEAQQQTGVDGQAALETALSLDPLSISANLFQALYLQRLGEYQQAQRFLDVARLLEPESPSIYLQLAQNSVLAGDVPGAREYYEQALALDPENLEMLKALAAYSVNNQIYIEEIGLPVSRRILLLAPQDPAALVLMGRATFLSNGQDEQAKVLFERAISINPNFVEAHLHLGLYLIAGEEFQLARGHFEHIVLIAPDTEEAKLATQIIEEYYR
jgi:Tfp pilus assembly protein PilF